MSFAEQRIWADRLEISGYLLHAQVHQAFLLREAAEVDTICEEAVEVEVVIDEKANRAGLKIWSHTPR